MKDVLMVIHTMASLEPTDNDRFTYLANMMHKKNNNVEIVTSDYEHHKKRYRNKDIVKAYPYKFTFLHENEYKKNISIKRIIGHISFALRLKKYLKNRKKPDVIYCAVPPTISSKVVANYARKNKIKFVVDVQDLWPESFEMILGNNIISKLLLYPMKRNVDNVYKQADSIIAVSNTFVKRAALVNEKAEIKESVYLGTDADIVDNAIKKSTLTKKENEFLITYIGNISKSYDFENLFNALYILTKREIKDIRFLVIGDGNLRKSVQKLAEDYFPNTTFLGYLPYDDVVSYLKISDIAVNPIIASSASTIVNKVGDYAAVGIPVVNTQSTEEYRNLVNKYNVGLNTIPENPEDIAEKILELYTDEKKRVTMGLNNRKLFEEMFNRKNTYTKIVNALLGSE